MLRFKKGSKARLVGVAKAMAHLEGKICEIIEVSEYNTENGTADYKIIFVDGTKPPPGYDNYVAHDASLQPYHDPVPCSWEDIEEIINWNPTKSN